MLKAKFIYESDIFKPKSEKDIINNLSSLSKEDQGIILRSACREEDKKTIRMLIAAGVDVNSKGSIGDTALMVTVAMNRKDIADILINAGADVNIGENHDIVPLHWAAMNGYVNMVKFLLEKGANIHSRDKHGRTALLWAISRSPISLEHEDIIKLLVDGGTNIDLIDNRGYTALMYAVSKGCKRMIKLLLDAGADINIRSNTLGATVMQIALRDGQQDIIDLLKKYRSTIEHRSTSESFKGILKPKSHNEIHKIMINKYGFIPSEKTVVLKREYTDNLGRVWDIEYHQSPEDKRFFKKPPGSLRLTELHPPESEWLQDVISGKHKIYDNEY